MSGNNCISVRQLISETSFFLKNLKHKVSEEIFLRTLLYVLLLRQASSYIHLQYPRRVEKEIQYTIKAQLIDFLMF